MAGVKGRSGPQHDHPWRNALMLALKDGNRKRLREIAEKVVALAAAGEPWAVQEVANRLDGRPSQAMQLDQHTEQTVQIIFREWGDDGEESTIDISEWRQRIDERRARVASECSLLPSPVAKPNGGSE
jgi:hypothetical protein